MVPEKIKEYCMKKNGAVETYPFGEFPVCYKVAGKIFAALYPLLDNYKITLKCEPTLADFYRQQYKDIVVRGYHCPPVQQPYNNTVSINNIDENVLLDMIDHSYERVLAKLPQKEYKMVLGITTKESIISQGGIYIENIQEGFERYHYNLIEGTKEEIYQKIDELLLSNGSENSYVDFYYGKLSVNEKECIRDYLSEKSFSILKHYERLKEPVFLSLTTELLFLTEELNNKELLFCTYYFCKYPCTIWGNYNLKYPIFRNKEKIKCNDSTPTSPRSDN